MHTPTVFDQTDHTGTGPLIYYNNAGPDEYLSDSSSCTDNGSDLGSDDYNNYESNYKSDSEETSCASTSTTRTPLVQPHAIYSLRKEKFNNDFTPKDLLNEIRKISLSPPRDMSDIIGTLDCLPIYSFLFPNEKGSSLYNAYDRDEVVDKLVIKIDQDDRAPKFSVVDDISEVYGLPGIHECINGQKPLRAVIDIDALQEDMEVDGVKSNEVFIRICCSFIRALYRILDCNWEDILKGLVIATSSDSSKCSYHILYAPALLIDHHELKAFTELVYTITGEKFGKYIDRGLPGQNFNLRLIGSAKKGRVKHILQFSLDNGWNELEHARVQPPTSLRLEVRPRMLSIEKNNNPLRISVGRDILRKYADLVLQKYSNYLRDWTIEEKDSENFVYFNRKAPLGCPLCKRIHDKDQRWFGRVYASSGEFIVKCFRQNSDEHGEIFECDPSIAEKIQQENKNSPQSSHKVKVPGFPKAFLKFPSWVKYNEPLSATETYEERYVRQLPNEGDIYVGSPWETGKTYVLEHLTISDVVNLLVLSTRHSYSNAVTTRLNLKSYCDIDGNINLPDHKRVVCQIESLHRITNNCKCSKKCKCPPIQYDLWLDEIVSIIAQAQSHLAGQSIEKLYKLIQEASYIETNAGTNQMLFRMWCIKDYICHIEQRSFNVPVTKKGLFQWLLHAKRECLTWELQNRGIFSDIDFIIWNKDVPTVRLWTAYMLERFRSRYLFDTTMSLSQTVKASSFTIKAKEIADVSNTTIVDPVEAIIRKDYREDKLIIATRAERHRICLELLRICTPAKDIDDRMRYKADDVKTRMDSPEPVSYLQGLVPKMARVFDNTDASHRAKKMGLKTIRAKLGLLNSALYVTYGLKFKAINKKLTQYHLVGSFDSENASKLPSYQTGEEVYWNNGEDVRYAYSKLTPDELLLEENSKTSLVPGLANNA
ncbi:hypothetical protein RhiirC2_791256 [Rhizophagus irregularis]|uniref:Replication origin-binding protein domain-containing protein n=1 Tax=Rhizophagus irregularis TaxID=588596 RepID=A0A2N1MJM2_9GLOM|nr:hypothetical protein RhiirC2_791256 [Rhizophagus irregularis]